MSHQSAELHDDTGCCRRILLAAAAAMVLVGTSHPTRAQEVRIPTNARQKCATCQFWGGRRSVSSDRRSVIASGTGLCNNPRSPVYGRQTRPDQGAPVWQRWQALG